MDSLEIHLSPDQFHHHGRCALSSEDFIVELFCYDTGVPAVRLKNSRGFLEVLPYCGQMIWSARFDGVNLTMGSPFRAPRPTQDLLATYGCFLYHSGILRNGNRQAFIISILCRVVDIQRIMIFELKAPFVE